jgi:hypothetical protein
MNVTGVVFVTFCLLAFPFKICCQGTEELGDVQLKEISASTVRLSWAGLPQKKCGEKITYAVYRAESEDFDPSPETQIAAGLIRPSFVARERKTRNGWYYRVVATRTQGYCAPPELNNGLIVTAPLDLGREYTVSVGEKTEACRASSMAELKCPSLPPFHAVIAAQREHEFLLGCLASDFDYGSWTCVNLTSGAYRITVHSQTVTVWDAGFKKINTNNGKELGDIMPVFSVLATLR